MYFYMHCWLGRIEMGWQSALTNSCCSSCVCRIAASLSSFRRCKTWFYTTKDRILIKKEMLTDKKPKYKRKLKNHIHDNLGDHTEEPDARGHNGIRWKSSYYSVYHHKEQLASFIFKFHKLPKSLSSFSLYTERETHTHRDKHTYAWDKRSIS